MYNPYYQYQPNGYNAGGYGNFQQASTILQVNGENGARAIRLAPNSSALALDTSAPIVWLCKTDGAGYMTIEPYDLTPHKSAQAPDISAIEKRIEKLEAAINVKSDTAKPKSKSNVAADSSD